MSSPPGPSGGPSKTHLLPGRRVPRIHRARSPVPPRLPRFATPRSVHQFAAVAAGAYQPRSSPNAWSPGAPAPPGPYYWLSASGTPLGWRGGCLAWGLGRGAVRHYCLGGCSAPSVCLAAGSGGSGRYLVLCLSRFPLPAPHVPHCVWRAVPSGCPFPSLAGTPFHVVCAFRELGPVALLVVPACPLRVCALALPRRPPPPPWVVWRAHLARSRHWALVGSFHVVRAPRRVLPRFLLRLACLGGGSPVPVPPYLAWGCVPPVRRVRGSPVPGGGFWGGAARALCPPFYAAGGSSRAGGCSASFRPCAFPGQATKQVSLASFWSWGAWPPYHSGSCSPPFSGRNLCGVLARWRGLACSPRVLWEPAAGAGGRAVLRLLSRAGVGGTIPPASGGWGPAPPWLAGRGGGWGRGRAAASLLPLWGAARGSLPCPPSCHRRTPPRRARLVGVAGSPRGGGDEGRPVDRSPGGPLRPEPSLCPPRVGNGHGGGHWGRGPHTVLVCRRVPLPGLFRVPLRRAGVGLPVGRSPRGSRWLGALGRAVCRSSRTPPPPPRVMVLSEGGRASPRLRGGGG